MPRPQRKAAIDAKEKLKTNEVAPRETRDSPAKKEEAEPTTKANGRGGGGTAAAKAGVEKKQPAKAGSGGVKKKEEPIALELVKPEMEEASEERSGDQPVVDDDATTAPVPERVSERRVGALSTPRFTTRFSGKPKKIRFLRQLVFFYAF